MPAQFVVIPALWIIYGFAEPPMLLFGDGSKIFPSNLRPKIVGDEVPAHPVDLDAVPISQLDMIPYGPLQAEN
jgi:hypothetical protein